MSATPPFLPAAFHTPASTLTPAPTVYISVFSVSLPAPQSPSSSFPFPRVLSSLPPAALALSGLLLYRRPLSPRPPDISSPACCISFAGTAAFGCSGGIGPVSVTGGVVHFKRGMREELSFWSPCMNLRGVAPPSTWGHKSKNLDLC